MDFALDHEQEAIRDAVTSLLSRYGGNARARTVGPAGHDDALLDALAAAGFLDVALEPTVGPLGAALIAEQVSRHNGRVNLAARALAAAALLGAASPPRVAITHRRGRGPVRFGQHAEWVLILDGDQAVLAAITGAEPVPSPYGYPFARIETGEERPLGPGSGAVLANWWRVALAVEIAGALQGAVAHTVDYLSHRVQFRRPLASLQALQHRLAEAHVSVEGATWLARSAAWHGAPAALAGAACAYATQVAQVVGSDMHQITGAIGFTTEFDLQLWTTRLHALRLEFGGSAAHQLETTTALWG